MTVNRLPARAIPGLTCLPILFALGCGRTPATHAHYKPIRFWVDVLKATDPGARRQAVKVLGNVGTADAAVIPALMGALKDPDAEVRRQSILVLLKLGAAARPAIPSLRAALYDPDHRVRSDAARALEVLQGS